MSEQGWTSEFSASFHFLFIGSANTIYCGKQVPSLFTSTRGRHKVLLVLRMSENSCFSSEGVLGI